MPNRSQYVAAIAFAVTSSVTFFPAASAQGAGQYDTVALTGPTGTSLGFGPNIGAGVDFSGFGVPTLNASGDIAFEAAVNGAVNGNGVFTNATGEANAAVAGGPGVGPGPNLGPGVDFGGMSRLVLNDAGNVAFLGSLQGGGVTSTNRLAIFRTGSAGVVEPLAREGAGSTPGPNAGPGIDFTSLEPHSFNGAGEAAFWCLVSGTPLPYAVFGNVGGTMGPVAVSGVGPTPNLGPGVEWATFYIPTINALGRVAFYSVLTGSAVDSTNGEAVFTSAGGTPAVVARSGSAGPGPNLGAGTTFNHFSIDPVVNDGGHVAFAASLAGAVASQNTGIFTTVGGTVAVVAREGSVGPGPNLGPAVNFGDFDVTTSAPSGARLVMNSAGEVAFYATLTGVAVSGSNRGIFTNAGGAVHAVARQGTADFGPNLGGGIVFSEFGDPAINGAGEVAFFATVSGPGVGVNDGGIFTNAGGTLVNVVREGDLFDTDPGAGVDLRTISAIGVHGNFTGFVSEGSFLGSGGEDGRPRWFNDAGVMTFRLTFTDGSSGVFTAQVPEPAGITGIAIATAMVTRHRSRQRVR